MSNISDDGLTPAQPTADRGTPQQQPAGDDYIPYSTPAPKAVSVAGPIPVAPPSPNNPANDGLTPVGDDDISTFAPPIVDHSLFKDSVLSTLHNEPSDKAFDDATALNLGDLKWPLMAFKGVSPDVAAQVDQLAKSNGIPYNLASSGKDDLAVLDQARKIYNSLSATDAQGNFIYPQTRKFYDPQNPINLGIAHDDIDALKGIEDTVRAQSQAGESSLYQTLRGGASGIEKSLGNFLKIPAIATTFGKSLMSVIENEAVLPSSTQDDFSRNANIGWEQATPNSDALNTLLGATRAINQHADANDGASLQGRTIGGDLSQGHVAGATQLTAVQLAGFLPTIAASAIDPALGLVQAGGSSAGGQYQNDLDAGKTPTQAGEDATLNGLINAVGGHALGTVGQFERMKALFSQPVARETATALWGRLAKQTVVSATQGAAGQGGIQAADDAADYETGNPDAFKNEGEKIATSALLGFVADGSMAAPLGALEGVRQLAAQEQGATAWQRLTGSAQQSKLLKRDPDALAGVIDQNLTAAGQPTTVGVDADKLTTFFQGRPANDLNNFAADMGLKPEEITNAAATGDAVDLPIGKYQAKYVGTPLDQAISKDLRFTPGGLSENELQDQIAHVQQLNEGIKAELAKTTSGTGNQLPAKIATMRDTLMTPKEEGGMGFTADQADGQLALLTAGLGRIAAHRGESVDDTINRLGLSLKVGDVSAVTPQEAAKSQAPKVAPSVERTETPGSRVTDSTGRRGEIVKEENGVLKVEWSDGGTSVHPVDDPSLKRSKSALITTKNKVKLSGLGNKVVVHHDDAEGKKAVTEYGQGTFEQNLERARGRARDIVEENNLHGHYEPNAEGGEDFHPAPEKRAGNLLVRNQGSNNNETTNEERARAGDPEAVANLVRDGAGTRGEVHGPELQTGEALHAADSEGQGHEALVESYRKVATKLGKDLPSSGLPDDAVPFMDGSEHHTSSSETDHRIYKILKAPEDYGISATEEKSNPASYLERHALQNKLFNDDTRWEGINEYGQTVVSQPHIKGTEPSSKEVNDYMRSEGFEPTRPKTGSDELPITGWKKGGVRVEDAQSFNFIKDEQGKIHAIDLAISHTPEAKTRFQDGTDEPLKITLPPRGEAPVVQHAPAPARFEIPEQKNADGSLAIKLPARPDIRYQSANQTETPEFKNWFGDSKVVDEQGKPKMVFHGTHHVFSAFDPKRGGKATGAASAKKGFFFTDNHDVATNYSTLNHTEGSHLKPVYLALKNPLIHDFNGVEYREVSFNQLLKQAKENGNDGAIFKNTHDDPYLGKILSTTKPDKLELHPVEPGWTGLPKWEARDAAGKEQGIVEKLPSGQYKATAHSNAIWDLRTDLNEALETTQRFYENRFSPVHTYEKTPPHDVYVAFNPEQIKSATGNSGKFDPSNPDIRHQDARGAITFADGKTTIHLFKTADFSTLAHEMGHLFLHEMQNMVEQGIGGDRVKADLQTLLDYAGVKPGEKLTIEQEEMIVKSFESHLRDGKAPSIELAAPFSRFRTWLSSIYRSVTSLGVTSTDEVKQVFDRWLASEDDISNAQHYYSRTNEVLNLIKGEEKDKEQVREKLAKVKQTELDKGVRAYMKSYLQAIGGVAEVRSKAKEVVEKQPIYQALDSAKEGKLDEEDLKARLGAKGFKEFVAKFPNLVKENGEHTLDDLAAKHNFQSPETLADNFMAAVPKSEAIKNYTSRLLAEKEQQIREEIMRQGATPADGVMHTEGSLAYLIAETNLMAKQLEKGKPVRIDARAYQAAARAALGAMPSSKAVQYSAFAKTEARLAKQVLDLAKKGQWEDGKPGADGRVKEGAITLRKKQIAQHVMVQEAIKIKQQFDAIEKRFKPKALEAKLKNVENAYVDPVRQILSNYGLSDTKPSTPYDLTKLQGVDPTLFAQLPTWILNGENKGSYKDLTWDQLQAVDSAARAVLGYGNDLLKSDLALKEKTIGELVEKSVATIDKLPENNVRQLGNSVLGNAYTRTLQKLDWLKSHLTKAQTLFDILDNFSIQRNGTAGTMRQLFDGLRVGEHNQSEAQRAVYNQAKPHLAILGKAAKRMRKENGTNFDIDGVQKPASYALRGDSKWTPEQLIAYMLNTGAEGNISALKNAFGHGPAEMDKIAQQFSTEELQAIDGLRDAVGTLYDGLNETNMKLYNRGVDKVDAVPQDFTDNSGAGVHLKGGYWPLVFDYGVNHLEGKVTDQDILANRIKGFMRSSKPEDGMTKSRVIGHALAPRLDMGVFADHVDDTTRFVHMAPLVRDISRVMQNKDWKEAAIRKVGASQYDQAVNWSQYQANPGRKQTSDLMQGLDKWADAGRTLATESALGFNFGGGLAWRTSMINSAVALGGWRHIANGLAGLGTRGLGTSILGLSNTKTWHMIEEKSNLLRTREAKGVRDLQQDVAKIKWNRFNYQIPGTKIQVNAENFKHFLYEWAKMNDRAVVAPVWMGAYQKFRNEMGEASMTDEEREKGAVNYADSIIQNSQPSSLNVDMNSMQRNQSAWVKMFTMFLSYPYTISNRFGYMYQAFRAGAITPAQYVSHVVQEGFLEPFARVGVHAAAKFTLPTAAALALAPMTNLIGAIPGIGTLWNLAANNFDPSELSPSFDVVNKAENIYEDVIHDKDVTKLAWDAARLGGYLTGVPVLNLAKTLLDWQAGASGSKNPYK